MGLHVGIIGSGFVGRVHIEAMLAHDVVSSVSVADSNAALRVLAASLDDAGRVGYGGAR